MSTVQLKRSSVASKVPLTTDLALGEIALNTYDGRIFFKKDPGTPSIVTVVTVDDTQTLTNKTLLSTTLTGSLTANSSVGTVGQVLMSSGSGVYWSAIPINATNLDKAANTSVVTINSSTGTGVDILAANSTTAGVLSADAQTISGIKTFTSSTAMATITTGTWNGSIVGSTYGGTGVNNGSSVITLGGNLTTSGAFATTLTVTGTTNVTLPTTGTLATLAASETFSNKTLSSAILTGTLTANSSVGTAGQVLATSGTGTYWVTVGGTRVSSFTTATSITINADTTDIAIMTNTQAAGAFTINAPTGTPVNGQKLMFRLKSTNVQTITWNAIFTGSVDLPLPTASSGTSLTDYFGFVYDSTATKWQVVAKNFGF